MKFVFPFFFSIIYLFNMLQLHIYLISILNSFITFLILFNLINFYIKLIFVFNFYYIFHKWTFVEFQYIGNYN